MKIADEILVKLGIVKKRAYDEVTLELEHYKSKFKWEAASCQAFRERAKLLEERIDILKKENEKLEERILELEKDYSDEVLKRFEISQLVNGRKAEDIYSRTEE